MFHIGIVLKLGSKLKEKSMVLHTVETFWLPFDIFSSVHLQRPVLLPFKLKSFNYQLKKVSFSSEKK